MKENSGGFWPCPVPPSPRPAHATGEGQNCWKPNIALKFIFVSNGMDRKNEKPYIYMYIFLRPFLFGFDHQVSTLRIVGLVFYDRPSFGLAFYDRERQVPNSALIQQHREMLRARSGAALLGGELRPLLQAPSCGLCKNQAPKAESWARALQNPHPNQGQKWEMLVGMLCGCSAFWAKASPELPAVPPMVTDLEKVNLNSLTSTQTICIFF